MSRLLIVSNRLPITLDRKDGELIYYPSAGGLATGLNSLKDTSIEKRWIGWAGHALPSGYEKDYFVHQFRKDGLIPVFLTKREETLYYEGFSNKTVWPLFHYFTQYVEYNEDTWQVYKEVNAKFTERVAEEYQEGDMIWVHDFQLMLVPGMLREKFPEATIGFFLHIPFPSFEMFRTLPWREEILNGILGSDLIGFHTFGYMRHFLSSVYRLTGVEHNFGKLILPKRTVNVDVFPMGIDYERYAAIGTKPESPSDEVQFIEAYGKRRKLIISIDRLDYSKGIPQRILAYEAFLSRYPRYHGEVTLILVVVPSRSNVSEYKKLKEQIDTMVGRINGKFGTFNWIPMRYYYRSFPFESLSAIYNAAKIAWITPLRDGMNLVAKEFVASKDQSKEGVLILSEMAGAATDMPEALTLNPNDQNAMVDSLVQAMEMPAEEQAMRMTELQKRLKRYDIKHWANNFIKLLMESKKYQQDRQTKVLKDDRLDTIVDRYRKAQSRLLLLDYDGTLVGFKNDPGAASPDDDLHDMLAQLRSQEGTLPVLISGRDRHSLGEWFGDTGIEMVSEHGVWLWRGRKWQLNEGVANTWKSEVRPILENLVDRTPGSFIEEKDYTLAWHYRRIDKDLGEKRVREIRDGLIYLTANHNLQVLEGNKVVEVRNAEVNKGKAALIWLQRQDWDFVLAIGDDHTDEDTFKALSDDAVTIKVGLARTGARFKVRSVEEARAFLKRLAEAV